MCLWAMTTKLNLRHGGGHWFFNGFHGCSPWLTSLQGQLWFWTPTNIQPKQATYQPFPSRVPVRTARSFQDFGMAAMFGIEMSQWTLGAESWWVEFCESVGAWRTFLRGIYGAQYTGSCRQVGCLLWHHFWRCQLPGSPTSAFASSDCGENAAFERQPELKNSLSTIMLFQQMEWSHLAARWFDDVWSWHTWIKSDGD